MAKNSAAKVDQVVVEQVIENPLDEYGTIIHPAPTEESLEGLMATYKTKSAVIRHLAQQGWTRGATAKFMGIRYQHVRNVLTQPLKKNG